PGTRRSMPRGFQVRHPGRMVDNSPSFQRSDRLRGPFSPAGTAETVSPQPSLRDLSPTETNPGVERPGYSRLSLSGHKSRPTFLATLVILLQLVSYGHAAEL